MSFLDRIVRATVGRAQVPESAPSPAMISASWRVWAWNEAARAGRPGRSTTEIQCDADSLLSWVFVPPASVDERPEGQDAQRLEATPASAVGEAETPKTSPIESKIERLSGGERL